MKNYYWLCNRSRYHSPQTKSHVGNSTFTFEDVIYLRKRELGGEARFNINGRRVRKRNKNGSDSIIARYILIRRVSIDHKVGIY